MANKNFKLDFEGVLDLNELTILESDKNGERLFNLVDALSYFNGRNVKLAIAEKEMISPTLVEDEDEE
jgi:hypothetical protein